MIELAVLADDLTGAMIIASKLEAAGVACPLLTSTQGVAGVPGDVVALVLARKIRFAPAEAARREAESAASAFLARGVRTIYYKYSGAFDSTAAGNIGPIAEALLGASGAARTVFCPAYVDIGLTVYKGHLFFGPTLVSDTAKRFDPLSPAETSDLVARLRAQTPRRVGLLDRQTLRAGAAAAAFERAPDTPFWIADAVEEADIDALAALLQDWPLVTGADSLAPALLARRRSGAPRQAASGRRLLPPVGGGEAVLAGSCGAATLAQLEAFETERPVFRVDLARDGDRADLPGTIAAWAAERLASGPVAVTTSAGPEGVAKAQAAFGRDGAAERAERVLGAVAAQLHMLGVRRFVVAGGETSGAVLSHLGVERMEVAAYDELYGGYGHSPSAAPVSVVLKPGGMGGPRFFFAALERMREAEQQAGKD